MDPEKGDSRKDQSSFITEVPKMGESPTSKIQDLYIQLNSQIKNLNSHID